MVPQQSCRVLAAAITLIACSIIMLSTTAKAEDVPNGNLPSTLSCTASEDRAACSCCPGELRTSYADGQLTLVGVVGSSGVDPCPGLNGDVTLEFQCDVDGDADGRCSGTHNGFEFGVSRSAGGDVELRAPCGSYTAVSTFPYVDCPTCSKASWNTNTFYQSNSLKLWTPFKEGDITNFYMVVNKKVTYQSASEFCEDNGASLAAIQTPAENSFLGDWLESNGIELPVWIGAKRANKKVGFKWNDLQMMDERGATFEKALTGTEARWGLDKEPLPACSHDAECAPDCCLMSNRKGTGKENCLMMGAPLSYLARDEVQRPFWYTAGCSKTKRFVCKKVRGKPPPTCGLPRGMASLDAINAASSDDPGRARRQSSSSPQPCSDEEVWCAGLIKLKPAACGDLQQVGQCRCSCSSESESESEDSDATSNVTTTITTTTIRKCNPRPYPEMEYNKTVCDRTILNMTKDEFVGGLCSEEYFYDECPIACAEDGYYCNYDPQSTTTTTTMTTTSTETTAVSKEEEQNSGDSGIADESSGLSGSSDNDSGSGSIEEPPTTTTSTMTTTTTTTTVTTVTRDPNCKVHPMIDGVNETQETDFLACSECIGRYTFPKDDAKPAVCTLAHCKHGNANSVGPYNNISDHEDCGVMPLDRKYCFAPFSIPQLIELCPFMCDDCPVTTTTTTTTATISTTTTTTTATTTTTLSTTTTTYVDQTCYLERDFNQTTNKLNDLAMPPREDDAVCGEEITKHNCDENELVKYNICPCMCTVNDPNTTLVDVAAVCNGGRDTDICKKGGSFHEYDCDGPLDDPTANAKRALCPVTCSSCTTTPSTSTATSTTTSTSTSTSTATSTTGMSTSTGPYCGPDKSVCDRLSATLCVAEQVFTWCPNMCNSTKCDTTTVTTSQTTTMCSTGPDNLFCPELPDGACELAKKGIKLDPTEGVSRLILNECGAMCDSCVTSTSTVTSTSSSTSTTTSTASTTSTSTSSSTVTTTSASTCNGSKDIEVCRGLTKPLCAVDGLKEILESMCPVLCGTCKTTEAPPTTTTSSSTSTSTSTATATLTPTTTSTSTSTSTSSTTSTSTTPFVNGQKVLVGCADGYVQESDSIDATSVYVCGNQGEFEPAVGQRALSCVLRPTSPPAATASPTAAPTPEPAAAATTVTMTTSAAPTSAPTNNQHNVFAGFDAVATSFEFNFDDAGAPLLAEIFKSTDRVKYELVRSEVLEQCLDACNEAAACGAVVISVAKVFADSHVYAKDPPVDSPANYTCINLGLEYEIGGAKAQDGSENGGEPQVYWGFYKHPTA